jgi:hypothetical protein
MPYTNKVVEEIPKWLQCPLCGDYETKYLNYFIKHFNNCENYDGHIDDIESYDIDDNITIGDFIKQELNCIETTKILIKTNELNNIQTQTPSQIREYIKNKLMINIPSYLSIDMDIIKIYEFFFGISEESENEAAHKFISWLKLKRPETNIDLS